MEPKSLQFDLMSKFSKSTKKHEKLVMRQHKDAQMPFSMKNSYLVRNKIKFKRIETENI